MVAIGAAGDGEPASAEQIARSVCAFNIGPIQFKPTLSADTPFIPDLERTLSYFVGGNAKYAEDKGFVMKPWTNVRFDNSVVRFARNIAIAMGHDYFTDTDGAETKVEYTKVYVKLPGCRVLTFLQDSSLPYSAH